MAFFGLYQYSSYKNRTDTNYIVKEKLYWELFQGGDNIVHDIAKSVEEQSQTAAEVAANIEKASMGISEVNENLAQSYLGAFTGVMASWENLNDGAMLIWAPKSARILQPMVPEMVSHNSMMLR